MRKGQTRQRNTSTNSRTQVVILLTNHTSSGPILHLLLAAVQLLELLHPRLRRRGQLEAEANIRCLAAFVVEQWVAAVTTTTTSCREVILGRRNLPEGALAAQAEAEAEVLTVERIPIIHQISSSSASHIIKHRCSVEAAAAVVAATVLASITTLITAQATAVLTAFTISTELATTATLIKNLDPRMVSSFTLSSNSSIHNSSNRHNKGTVLDQINPPILT